jgi:SMI1/KNR4 family protein SUKH-1
VVTEGDWSAVEAALGRKVPDDCRAAVAASAGLEGSMPDAYVALWPLSDVIDANVADTYEMAGAFPGLLLIGTNGGGELVAIDLNQPGEPVVVLNMISSSWDEVSDQGASLADWVEHLRTGGSFKFG